MTSMRAASYTRWSQQHPGADFVAGILLFWLVALCLTRRQEKVPGAGIEPARPFQVTGF